MQLRHPVPCWTCIYKAKEAYDESDTESKAAVPGAPRARKRINFLEFWGRTLSLRLCVCVCVCDWLIYEFYSTCGSLASNVVTAAEFGISLTGLDGTHAPDASDTESPGFDTGHPCLTHSWRSRCWRLWLWNSDDSVYGWLCFRDIYTYICIIYLKVILMALTPLTPLTVENGRLGAQVTLFQR